MYFIPLPELERPSFRGDIVNEIRYIPDDQWWTSPSGKTLWYQLHPKHEVYNVILSQFAIEAKGAIEISYYRLKPMAELFNHRDTYRNASLNINIANYSHTRLFFYDGPKVNNPMVTVQCSAVPILLDALTCHGVSNDSMAERLAINVSFNNPYDYDTLENLYKERSLLNCQQKDDYRFPNSHE